MNDRQLRACISTHLINPNPLSFYFLSVLRSYTRSLFVQFLLFFFLYIYIYPNLYFFNFPFFYTREKKKKKRKKKKKNEVEISRILYILILVDDWCKFPISPPK